MDLETLVEISRFYGKNPDYVLAGGGNTSWKDEETLYVKASGTALADALPAYFVKMDRKALANIWKKQYPESADARESAVLADMMAARKAGENEKRPSVEALLHDVLPFTFVVHLHPALVNGLTCSARGEEAMSEIFGETAIWIPETNPGYVLSQRVKIALDAYNTRHGKPAAIIFLQNHGVFVGAGGVNGIKEIYGEIMHKIGAWIKRRPDFSDEKYFSLSAAPDAAPLPADLSPAPLGEILKTLAELAGFAACVRSAEIAALIKDRGSFVPVSSSFTPDHIVYAGSAPLFTEANTAAGIREAWKNHADKTGRNPKIIAVRNLGVFSAAATEKAASLALELFKDAVKVAVYSESFGGPRFMAKDKIDFIDNWEVERFRSNISTK